MAKLFPKSRPKPSSPPPSEPISPGPTPAKTPETVLPVNSFRQDRTARLAFLAIYAAILVAAFALRTYRMDLPPIDYPASRQIYNGLIARTMMAGQPFFSFHAGWIELQIQAWIAARTAWLCGVFGCELWTLGRFWSVFFSALTVALAAPAAFLIAPAEWPLRRRLRVALILTALLAFNPYLLIVSRILMNEPISLCLQMQTLVLFLAFRRAKERRMFVFLGLFLVSLVLTGWAKLPGLVWGPAYAFYLLFDARLKPAARYGALAALAAAACAALEFYGLNPLTIVGRYRGDNPGLVGQIESWSRDSIWLRTFIGKSLLMTGVPAAFFVLPGLFRAPRLFLFTFAGALGLGFIAVNLNLYNSCHLIIPASAIAAWGIDWLVERAGAHRRAALAAIAAVFILGSRLTPAYQHGSDYRADALQGWKAVRQCVPAGTAVPNDGIEDNPSILGFTSQPLAPQLDLSSGYYLTFQRFDPRIFADAMKGWVRWASLPAESGAILYSKEIDTLEKQSDRADFIPIPVPPSEIPFRLSGASVPRAHFDPENNRLVARAGETLRIGLEWSHGDARLALMTWQSDRLGQILPPPIRQGGAAFRSYAALSLPSAGQAGTAVYTFEIPRSFPPGEYRMLYWGISDPAEAGSVRNPAMTPFPLTLHIEPDEAILHNRGNRSTLDFAQAYPQYFGSAPNLWSEGWLFKNIRLEGMTVSTAAHPRIFYVPAPGSMEGRYRLSLIGSSSPLLDSAPPGERWVSVQAAAIGTASEKIGSIALSSEKAGEFTLDFQAHAPFDTLALTVPIPNVPDKRRLLFPTEYIPQARWVEPNQQAALLRSVSLEPR